jgi:hypothetical protein
MLHLWGTWRERVAPACISRHQAAGGQSCVRGGPFHHRSLAVSALHVSPDVNTAMGASDDCAARRVD